MFWYIPMVAYSPEKCRRIRARTGADVIRPPDRGPYRTAEKVVKIHFSPTRS